MLTSLVEHFTRLSFLIDVEDDAPGVPLDPPAPAPASAPPVLSAGQRIGAYVVEAPLARGGMATLWHARHTRLGSRHALKVPLVRDPAIYGRALR